MFLVYIAGPYTGRNHEEIEKNIQRARKYALALSEKNIGFICPHLNTAHFGSDSSAPEQFYYILGLELLKNCNAMLVIPDWQKSKGTKMEISFAQHKGIPIFYATSLKNFGGLLEYTQTQKNYDKHSTID